MKNKILKWIVGIGCGDRQYKIGGVTYTVSSRFESTHSENKINDRIKRTIVSDFAPLTLIESRNKMADEYVCSGCIASDDARREDNNAVEKE